MRQVSNRNTAPKYIYSVIFDMNNIMKISSVNHKVNDKGEEYGIVETSLRIIGNVLKKKDFDYCIAAYDGLGSGILRWNIYNDYKANRGKNYEALSLENTDYMKEMKGYSKAMISYTNKKNGKEENDDESFERQREILQLILEELCVRQHIYDNVEGDDIISYFVKNKKDNEKIVIVSSDRDLTQLISDTVIVYNPRIKDFITVENSVEKLGITHENIVLEKILCGDASDNIKGVKGMGETTLLKLFPELINEKRDLKAVVSRSKELLDNRKAEGKKPLKTLENVLYGITDGCQGDKLYEINEKIIDLSNPLLTEEAEKELSEELYAPMDTDSRDIKNVYKIVNEHKLYELTNENRFGDIFGPFSRIIMMEKRRFENAKKEG